jgi:hypothetical protein
MLYRKETVDGLPMGVQRHKETGMGSRIGTNRQLMRPCAESVSLCGRGEQDLSLSGIWQVSVIAVNGRGPLLLVAIAHSREMLSEQLNHRITFANRQEFGRNPGDAHLQSHKIRDSVNKVWICK